MMTLCPGRTAAQFGMLSSPIAGTPQGAGVARGSGAREQRPNRHPPFSMSACA